MKCRAVGERDQAQSSTMVVECCRRRDGTIEKGGENGRGARRYQTVRGGEGGRWLGGRKEDLDEGWRKRRMH